MFKKFILINLLFCLAGTLLGADKVPQLLEKYCFKCHSNKKSKGKLNFEVFSPEKNIEKLEDIRESLKDHDMPPEDEIQPSDSERQELISWTELYLQKYVPKETPVRRLTRLEYDNTVRDLFGLRTHVFALPERIIRVDRKSSYFQPSSGKMPLAFSLTSRVTQKGLERPPVGVSPLPVDYREENGFDNNAHMLNVSPKLMSKYLSLARSLLNSRLFEQNCSKWKEIFSGGATNLSQARVKSRSFLSQFLPAAFRKSLEKNQLERYLKYFEEMYNVSSSYSNALKETVAAVMASPDFLYVNHKMKNSHSISARLSYFLWGSIPDEGLRKLAENDKELYKENIIRQEVKRMINDQRVKHLTYGFAMQWLQLEKMMAYTPDKDLYNNYYYDKRYRQQHAGQFLIVEPLLLFENVLVENRSITDFIHADYTFVNNKLMSYYKLDPDQIIRDGKESPKVNKKTKDVVWFKVKLKDMKRGGVITSGACLTMTSTPLRSSPIRRGAWVSNVIFNDPPPPPPANVASLEEEESKDKTIKLTIRERLKHHRADPNCNTCHAKIDPLGFALENFNATGQWREFYRNKAKVDASSKLGNAAFNDAMSFKKVLLEKKEIFARAFVEYILSYALNRQTAYADEKTVNLILDRTRKHNFRLRDILIETAVLTSLGDEGGR